MSILKTKATAYGHMGTYWTTKQPVTHSHTLSSSKADSFEITAQPAALRMARRNTLQ